MQNSPLKLPYKYLLQSIILFGLVMLLPFQDFILKNTALKQFGTNMSLPYILIIFLVLSMKFFFQIKLKKKNLILILFMLGSSFILLLSSDFYVKETPMLLKLVKNIIFNLQPLVVFYIFFYFYRKKSSLVNGSLAAASFVYFLFFCYVLLYQFMGVSFDTMKIIHANENSNMRFRLFSEESSIGTTVYITYGILSLVYFKNNFLKFLIVVSILWGLLLFQSKGAFIVFLFILAYLSINSIKVLLYITMILLFLFIFIDIIGIVQSFILDKSEAFSEYSSFSTRVGMIIASMISLIHYPFGTGLGTYISYFDTNIILSIDFMNNTFPKINVVPVTDEINGYLSTAKAYGTKSTFFNYIMYFGFIGIYIFIKLELLIWRQISNSNLILKTLFLYLTITHIFFVDSVYLYHFWFAFAIMYFYDKESCKCTLA